jgi:diguanylate cyclase (GGDEF)-like protein/PAS domain S-box-containing protein
MTDTTPSAEPTTEQLLAWTTSTDAIPPAELLGHLGDLALLVDPAGLVAGLNDTATSLLNLPADAVLGTSALELVHPEDLDAAAELLARFSGGTEMARPSIRLCGNDGPSLAVELVARRLERADGNWILFSGRIEPLLNTDDMIDGIGVGIVLCDSAGVITESNRTAARLLGDHTGVLSGSVRSLSSRFSDPIGADRSDHSVTVPLAEALDTLTPVHRRLGLRAADGTERIVDVEARPVRMRYSGVSAAMMTLRDITDEFHAQLALLQRASTDDLTGTANRSSFIQQVDAALQAPDRTGVGLLFCDLDRFKSVNERFGHGEADRLLTAFARRLLLVTSSSISISRLGGDEFAVAVHATSSDELDAHAEAIREAARTAGLETLHLTTTVSVGTSWSDPFRDHDGPAPTAASMIEEADEALRRAKRTGRDRTAFFDATMRSARAQQTSMAAAVREHLEAGRVEIAVQPVVDPRTGRVSGGEALARIRDADGELVPAAEWVDAAARTGQLAAVDEQVVELAAGLIAELHARVRLGPAAGTGVSLPVIGVNLSDGTLARPDLEDWLIDVFRSNDAALDHLLIEIPETVFPVIRERSAEALRRLKANGAWVAIDDFGVGYASLAEVRDLPIDTLKIDRSFVVAEPGTTHEAILRASLEMAKALGCRSVAEGVETRAQLELLLGLGVDYVQGYLTGRPLPAAEFADHALERLGVA